MEATKSATIATNNLFSSIVGNMFTGIKAQVLGSIHIPEQTLWIICAIPVVIIILFFLWFWWNFLR